MNHLPELHIIEDNHQWQEAVVAYITGVIADTLQNQEYCSISLSGGSTPRQIYEKLAKEGEQRGIPWASIRLFWGDERAVAHTHEDSNYRMVKAALLDHINIPSENVFPFPHPDKPSTSADAYEKTLREVLPGQISWDLSLLGMGDDGHTASLFPHTQVIQEQNAWVQSVYIQAQDTHRISVTAPIINQSRNIAFLVRGANKAPALKEVLQGEFNPTEYPAQLIRKSPHVHYFLDPQAAELIRR